METLSLIHTLGLIIIVFGLTGMAFYHGISVGRAQSALSHRTAFTETVDELEKAYRTAGLNKEQRDSVMEALVKASTKNISRTNSYD